MKKDQQLYPLYEELRKELRAKVPTKIWDLPVSIRLPAPTFLDVVAAVVLKFIKDRC